MHACIQSAEVAPPESTQSSTTLSSSIEATSTTSATAAEGDGEEREKEEVAPQPVATPAAVPEPVPVKEEPKGPRPTASVPVPGTQHYAISVATYMYMYMCIHAHTTYTCMYMGWSVVYIYCGVSVYSWSGTPWSVVWTSDNRQFFFDVTSRVSLWIMPEELKDNPQLMKILENGPDGNSKSYLSRQLAGVCFLPPLPLPPPRFPV